MLTRLHHPVRSASQDTEARSAAGLERSAQAAPPDAASASQSWPTGAKARRLLELQQAGLPVPPFRSLPADLHETLDALGFPVAVRSSAEAEDGRDVSFAGQFKSFLNLRSLTEVQRAVDACVESASSSGVLEYCRRAGLDPDSLRMGVFIQRMIDPELAGVAFTLNPLTGADEVIIEACAGLADELLQGHQPALPQTHPLLERYRPAIEELARAAQRVLGTPLDIEFAVAHGRLYILQARPITRISFHASAGEWTNADFRDGGVASGVCTPLMWSLYDYIWQETLTGFLREIKLLRGDFQAGRLFFGRPYWNLGAVKDCLLRLPGFVERDFDRDLGVQIRYEGPGRTTPVTWAGLVRALPTAWAVRNVWRRQARFDQFYLESGFSQWAARCAELPLAADTLERLVHGIYHKTESNYFRTIFCVSLAKLDFLQAFPQADSVALMGGLPNLAHLEPVHLMRQMAQMGAVDPDAIIRRFPHRSRRELDISVPRWDEDRAWVQSLVEQSPWSSLPATSREAYETARTNALRHLRPKERPRFLRKLERLRRFLWLREQMRDLSTRVYHMLRRCVVSIAKERGLGDDIFFMRWQEILTDDRARISSARAHYESYRHFAAPNEIGARYCMSPPAGPGSLKGLGASPGRVTAVASVAHTVEQAAQVARGSILVCPFTDPGWTPILSRVAGIITETGGLLSHAAVICREFGIPAVLAVPQATRRLRDGATITIDGQTGYVEVGR